jgi:hypothetical protein
MSEPKRTFLGALALQPGEAVTIIVPDLNAPVEEIEAAIEAAEQAKREAAALESQRLRELFHLPDASKTGLS